jgi:hypothetical protein
VTKRCKHVNFVAHSLIVHTLGHPDAGQPSEMEYLFAAFSIFTVRAVTWGVGGAPHHIELDVASDNKVEAEGGAGWWATPVESESLANAPWA